MVKTASFKRLILRAVLRQVSPMVIRLVSVADQMPLHEFHDVLRTILGWNGRAAPPEDCAGGLDYLKRLDWHRSHLPIDELNIMAEAMRRFLDSDGNRHAIGDLDELREAVDRVKAYQDFQPDKFDQRELNRRLRTLTQDREVRG